MWVRDEEAHQNKSTKRVGGLGKKNKSGASGVGVQSLVWASTKSSMSRNGGTTGYYFRKDGIRK